MDIATETAILLNGIIVFYLIHIQQWWSIILKIKWREFFQENSVFGFLQYEVWVPTSDGTFQVTYQKGFSWACAKQGIIKLR